MDIENLFNPVAEYFDFIIDFVMIDGLNRFARLGSVSPKLISFLFLGILFGMVIKKAKAVPTFSAETQLSSAKDNDNTSTQFDTLNSLGSPELLLLVLLQLNGALLTHFSLIIVSHFQPFEFGNLKDSINATIAVSSIQYPIYSLLNRVLAFFQKIHSYNRATKVLSISVHVILILVIIVPAWYYYKMISIVHNISMSQLTYPAILSIAFIMIFISVAVYFILIWQKIRMRLQ